LHIQPFENEPALQKLIDKIVAADPNWRVGSLPLGLKRAILQDAKETKHFDGFASVNGYKADAEEGLLRPIKEKPNFKLLTDREVIGLEGTAHALGSLVAGDDPASSVVDANDKVHDMKNLYVGDGSVLPRSSKGNPALTIFAWGLRLGDHLAKL
jgi:choline dehydrogenase-like flavoprotein